MPNKIEEFINKAIQTAKYAALASSNPDTVNQMIAELEAEAGELKREVSDVLCKLSEKR